MRRQLPAYSPLTLRAVLAAGVGALSGGAAARRAVTHWLADTYGAGDVLLTDSGTAALTLAIRACLADRPERPVALPAYGCYDLATAADGAGARVVLYDLEPETLAPEQASLERALALGAGAVVLAHWYGVPADPEPVRRLAAGAGARLIEDAAQAAGATIRGRPAGAFGDLVVLSFGRGKGTTAGRGGALLAHGAESGRLLDAVRGRCAPRARGWLEVPVLKAQWLLGRPSLYAVPASLPFLRLGETVYHAPRPAAAMSAAAAGALARTHELGAAEVEIRRGHAARLLNNPLPGLTPVRVARDLVPGYLRLPLLASPAARAAALTTRARSLGVMPGYPAALCDLPGFGERVLNREHGFAGARRLAAELVTLPTHGLLTERDMVTIERWGH